MLALQRLQAPIHFVGVNIRHCHQFDGTLIEGGERLIGGTGAAAAAADEGNLERVTAGRMGRPLNRQGAEKAAADDGSGGGS